MNTYSLSTRIASLVTLALALGVTPQARAAEGDVDVIIQLRNDPTPLDPTGNCSSCRANSFTSTAASAHEQAVLDFYYADDSGEDIEANLVFTVVLESNEIRTVLVSDVDLYNQTTDAFLVPSGYDWQWTDVKHAWVEVELAS